MNQIPMNQMQMNQMQMNQMQMNQIPINQILMNQMPMNQMPMHQINNIDNTTLNVKSIVQPYENKIKDLEEIIRQKDFEIAVLKQKLNKLNNNFMNMNINPVINQNLLNGMDDNPSVGFTIKSEQNEFRVYCFLRDELSSLRQKYNINGIFTYNYKPLNEKLSFKENRVRANSIIHIKSHLQNVIFNTFEYSYNLIFAEDCPIGVAIISYIIKYDNPLYAIPKLKIKNNLKNIRFSFGNLKLNFEDDTPLYEIFKGNLTPRIDVLYS